MSMELVVHGISFGKCQLRNLKWFMKGRKVKFLCIDVALITSSDLWGFYRENILEVIYAVYIR